ncbi:MAG: ADP-ribosyltransferase domain-containing protein [Paludibacteraceae bacterium]|nr:ADP-ribosyltransferase domain-containing protein [Paludibacteraceae bacterium]
MLSTQRLIKIAKIIISDEKWIKFESDSEKQGWKRKKSEGGYEYRYQEKDPNVETTKETTEGQPKEIEEIESLKAIPKYVRDDWFNDIKSVDKLGGSTGAVKVVTENAFGTVKEMVVKTYENNGGINQIKNEYLANSLYRELNISVPETYVGYYKGKPALITKFLHGKEAQIENDRGILEGFVADAWLANWDSIGLSGDNVLYSFDNTYRIDNGGALLFRAQGEPKGKAFGDEVTELDSFRSPEINVMTAKAFDQIKDSDIMRQAMELEVKMTDEKIRSLVESVYNFDQEADFAKKLSDRLINRKKYIISYAKKLAIKGIQDNVLKRKARYVVGEPSGEKITVTDNEIIRNYTSFGFRGINKYLRGEIDDPSDEPKFRKKSSNLVTSLKKLQPYTGKVYRGSHLDDATKLVMVTMKPGDLIYMKAFTSTSKSASEAEYFTSDVNFEIESLTGREVVAYSKFPTEEEVIMSPDTRYEITDIQINPDPYLGNTLIRIKMKELLSTQRETKIPSNMRKREPSSNDLKDFLLKNPKLTQKQRERIMRLPLEDLKKLVLMMFTHGKKNRVVNKNVPEEQNEKFTEIFI